MNALSEEWKRADPVDAVESYNPELLFDLLMHRMHLTEDSELAKRLKLDKQVLKKIRERRLQISGSMLMHMQESTGITIAELRRILGDRRGTSRMVGFKAEQRR